MARPKGKELPYFSKLLELVLKEFKGRTNFDNNWSNKQTIVNSILKIIIHDEVDDELKTWWQFKCNKVKERNLLNKQMIYSNVEVSKICSGKKFLDYRIWKYYQSELKEGKGRFHKNKFIEAINNSPLSEGDRLKEICTQFNSYINSAKIREDEYINCLNMGQLSSLYQNGNFVEFFAICLLFIASDMYQIPVEETNKIYYVEEDNSFLDNFIESVKFDLAEGKFFDEVDIYIHISPVKDLKMYRMVTKFKYHSPTIKKSGKSYFVSFKFLFESEELSQLHELNSITINDIEYTDRVRVSSSFHDVMNRGIWSKVYEVDGIVPSDYYRVERTCTSYLRFPIGDIIYRLPRLSKYFKVIIELVAEGVSAHKLDGSLFAPLEKDELRKFKRNRMLLEFEGEGFFPKGTGYKVMVRPILSILNQYGEKNASCSEEEIEENQKWN